jgi:hypothetical protein
MMLRTKRDWVEGARNDIEGWVTRYPVGRPKHYLGRFRIPAWLCRLILWWVLRDPDKPIIVEDGRGVD